MLRAKYFSVPFTDKFYDSSLQALVISGLFTKARKSGFVISVATIGFK
jgi:hypothetical protein